MKELTKTQSLILLLGGSLMVVGAGIVVLSELSDTLFMRKLHAIVPWFFLLGAVAFASIQIHQSYSGESLTIRRLKNLMTLSDILFILSGLLMIENVDKIAAPFFPTIYDYYQFLYKKWVISILVAAILQLYTTHRIHSELGKEQKPR